MPQATTSFAIVVATCLIAASTGVSRASDAKTAVAELLATAGKSTPQADARAQQQYAELLEAQGDSPKLRAVYALVLIEQHRYAEALEALGDVQESDVTAVEAQTLKVWANLSARKYPETLSAMETLGELLQKVASAPDESPNDSPNDSLDDSQRTAFFLGQVVGFLEGPRGGAVDSKQVAATRAKIVDRIGTTREGSFEEGRSDVLGRYEQWSQELTRLKSTVAADQSQQLQQAQGDLRSKQAEFTKNEAKQDSKSKRLMTDAEELAKINNDLKTARDAYDVVQARITVVRAQLTNLNASATPGPRGVASSVAASERRELNGTLSQLNSQLADISAKVQAMINRRNKLAASGRQESQQMAQRDAELRKQKKLIHHTEKQLAQTKSPERSPEVRALTSQIASFASYEEFPFERLAKRFSLWFE